LAVPLQHTTLQQQKLCPSTKKRAATRVLIGRRPVSRAKPIKRELSNSTTANQSARFPAFSLAATEQVFWLVPIFVKAEIDYTPYSLFYIYSKTVRC